MSKFIKPRKKSISEKSRIIMFQFQLCVNIIGLPIIYQVREGIGFKIIQA